MLPLAEVEYVQRVIPFYSLDGMTLLLGAFFFYALARPSIVKYRTQFWAVFVCLLAIIVLYTLRLMLSDSAAGQVFTGVFIGILQAAGLVLTVMYVGGLRPHEIAEELREAAEDFRQAAPAKTPIVPLSGDTPAKPVNVPVQAPIVSPKPAAPPRVVIDLPKTGPDDRLPLE